MGRAGRAALGAAIALLCAGRAAATTLDFEDLVGNGFGSAVDWLYHGFNWGNGASVRSTDVPVSGYAAGTTSGLVTMLNSGGADADITVPDGTFDFVGANFTAGWLDGLNLQIDAFSGGVQVDSASFVLSATAPMAVLLNWTGIDQLTLTTSGGTAHAGYCCQGAQYAMDDFTFTGRDDPGFGTGHITPPTDPGSDVPEPSAWALMLAGLTLAGGALRRRRTARWMA